MCTPNLEIAGFRSDLVPEYGVFGHRANSEGEISHFCIATWHSLESIEMCASCLHDKIEGYRTNVIADYPGITQVCCRGLRLVRTFRPEGRAGPARFPEELDPGRRRGDVWLGRLQRDC
jgi:hypothetical protein